MLLLTHLCQMYFPILINWTSPFPILGLLGGICHFYSNFKRNLCKQTVENQIRRRILRRLIWFCTACRCPTKKDARPISVKSIAEGSMFPNYFVPHFLCHLTKSQGFLYNKTSSALLFINYLCLLVESLISYLQKANK